MATKNKKSDQNYKIPDEYPLWLKQLANGIGGKKNSKDSKKVERWLRIEEERYRLFKTALKSVDSFQQYIRTQSNPEKTMRRVTEIVHAHKLAMEKMEQLEPKTYTGLSQNSIETQYVTLVKNGLIDFGEILGVDKLSICGLVSILGLQKMDQELKDFLLMELSNRWVSLSDRWEKMTGRKFIAQSTIGCLELDSSLEDLLTCKAPVPCKPAWNEQIANREFEFHTTNRQQINNILDRGANEIRGVRISKTEDHDSLNDVPKGEDTQTLSEHNNTACCDVAEIMAKAGGKTLSQPGPEDDLYTFPGPLGIREDIFFDYSVILPFRDCFNPIENIEQMDSEWLAVNIAAEQAKLILKDPIISNSLGLTLSELLENLVDEIIDTDTENATPSDIKALRRQLRQAASSIKLLRNLKLQAATAPEISSLESMKSTVEQALSDLNAKYTTDNIQVPSTNTEKYADVIEPYDDTRNVIKLENVVRIGSGTPSWGWRDGSVQDQQDQAGNWIKAVGDIFIPAFDEYKDAVNELINSLEGFIEVYNASFENADNIERFYNRKLFNLRSALARIFEELAQIIPISSKVPREGNKRLAVQLIYRQYWIPEGYVRGKLVGYKNLPPDTEESIKRRTIVKTKRETTTVENFAATQQRDYSNTRKETSETTREISEKFGIKASASASCDFTIVANFGGKFGAETVTDYQLGQVGKSIQTMLAESVVKGSMSYNEKKEVKISEIVDIEDEFESVTKIRNSNKEITANYFYYQLLRQYLVTVELNDIRPVLLRTKELPSEAEIDETFLGQNAHILAEALPAQLASDLLEVIDEIEALGRTLTHAIATADDREASYEAFRATDRPNNDPETNSTAGDDWDARLESYERIMTAAREVAISAEDAYLRATVRLNRVKAHVRKNRAHYMQFIWNYQPKEDEDMLLENEKYGDYPLPQVTRGLIREGYYGQEEIFTYNGPSIALAELMVENMIAGSDITASMSEAELRETALFQQLSHYYSDQELDNLIEKIGVQAFIVDPTPEENVLSSRHVQIAQDALIVETMPGQVPLLEAYQMAQRYLAVERECLHNVHLRGRIEDKTWSTGTDSLRIYRREGEAVPVQESEPIDPNTDGRESQT